MIVYALISLYLFYLLYFLPMLIYVVNCFLCGTAAAGFVNSIVAICHLLYGVSSTAVTVAPILAFFIGTTVSWFWASWRRKLIIGRLSNDMLKGDTSEEAKFDYFDSLVFTSSREAATYVQIGFAFHADLVADFSFLKYMQQTYEKPQIMFEVARIACFFPDETEFLGRCLGILRNLPVLAFGEQYLLYQMERTFVFRGKSSSPESTASVLELKRLSRETISQIRGFWGEILHSSASISLHALQLLRSLTESTTAAFLSAIHHFPHEVDLHREFCIFQIESGDFQAGLETGLNVSRLEAGEQLTVDTIFRSMINTFPDYLLLDIVDETGHFRDVAAAPVAARHAAVLDQFARRQDEILDRLFTHGRLRLALQDRMKGTRLWPITVAIILGVAQFLFLGLFSVIVVVALRGPAEQFRSVTGLVESGSATTNGIIDLAVLSALQSFNVGASTPRRIRRAVDNLHTSFSQFLELAVDFRVARDDNSPILSSLSIEGLMYSDSVPINASVRTVIANMLTTASQCAILAIHNISSPAVIAGFQHVMFNSVQFAVPLLNVLTVTVDRATHMCDEERIWVAQLLVIVAGVVAAIFAIARIVTIILIWREAGRLSDMLRKVKKDDIEGSFAPIAINNQRGSFRGGSTHTSHGFNVMIILYGLTGLIGLFIAFSLYVWPLLQYSNEAQVVVDIFLLQLKVTRFFQSAAALLIIPALKRSQLLTPMDVLHFFALYRELFDIVGILNTLMTMGSEDAEFDRYFGTHCPIGNSTEFEEFSACLSVEGRAAYARALAQMMADRNIPTDLETPSLRNFVDFMDRFLTMDLGTMEDLIGKFSSNAIASLDNVPVICCIIAASVALIGIMADGVFIRAFSFAVSGVKQLIGVLPPTAVVDSDVLMQFVDGSVEQAGNDVLLSTSQMILSSCATAAILVKEQGNGFVVQTVNREVKKITGFAPDQLLGRTIDWVVPPDTTGADECRNAHLVEFLQDDTVPEGATVNFVVQVITETGGFAVMMCDVLKLPGDSALLLLRDITDYSQKRQLAEAIRARTERILESLIPSAVRHRPLQRVDFATLIFIEIIGIAECIPTVPPSELLRTLNSVYERIDATLATCPNMLVVKGLERLFVGAVGLIGAIPQDVQVSEAVGFAFSLREQIEEMLDPDEQASIRLKIVVNTGGPIVFGTLSREVPNFELWGPVVTETIAMLRAAETEFIQITPVV
jgi:PAS domain-containing protein